MSISLSNDPLYALAKNISDEASKDLFFDWFRQTLQTEGDRFFSQRIGTLRTILQTARKCIQAYEPSCVQIVPFDLCYAIIASPEGRSLYLLDHWDITTLYEKMPNPDHFKVLFLDTDRDPIFLRYSGWLALIQHLEKNSLADTDRFYDVVKHLYHLDPDSICPHTALFLLHVAYLNGQRGVDFLELCTACDIPLNEWFLENTIRDYFTVPLAHRAKGDLIQETAVAMKKRISQARISSLNQPLDLPQLHI